MANLIDIIAAEMESDNDEGYKEMPENDRTRVEQSRLLKGLYDKGNEDDKNIIDNVLLCLCGWTMEALKSMEKIQ